MGDYATTTSFPQLLPYLLKSNSESDSTGVAIIAAHILRAEAVVNSYLVNRYASQVPTGGWGLPWGSSWGALSVSVPPILRTLTEDIASYYVIRGSYVQDGQRKNEYAEDFKFAIKQLEEIRDGKISLADTSGTIIAQATTGRYISSTKNYAPTFNDDAPENWETDNDKESDIASGR
jgi:phage gp36-like protein